VPAKVERGSPRSESTSLSFQPRRSHSARIARSCTAALVGAVVGAAILMLAAAVPAEYGVSPSFLSQSSRRLLRRAGSKADPGLGLSPPALALGTSEDVSEPRGLRALLTTVETLPGRPRPAGLASLDRIDTDFKFARLRILDSRSDAGVPFWQGQQPAQTALSVVREGVSGRCLTSFRPTLRCVREAPFYASFVDKSDFGQIRSMVVTGRLPTRRLDVIGDTLTIGLRQVLHRFTGSALSGRSPGYH
jgi:hypothetical protein